MPQTSDGPFVKLAGGLALFTALAIAILPPLGFYGAGYLATNSEVKSEIAFKAKQISQLISGNPEFWRFEDNRISQLLKSDHDAAHIEYLSVVDAENSLIAKSPAEQPGMTWPSITQSEDLLDFGQPVGQITITRSLEGVTQLSLLIGLFSILAASLVYWALRVIPVRLLQRAWTRISFLATHDTLTGLPNRAMFLDGLNTALERVQGAKVPVLVYSLDFDRFKDINDSLGHAAGDLLLKIAASRIQNCLRPEDMLARLGGDEFAIFQAGISDPVWAAKVAARIIKVIKEPFDLDGHEAVVGTSIGIAIVEPGHLISSDDLLRQADLALYKSKNGGRGAFHFFHEKMDAELQERKLLEVDLRRALRQEEFELHYQPQIDLNTNRIIGVEALLRWHHKRRGNVTPGEIIPIIESSGMMAPLTEWILNRACRETLHLGDVRVAVNLSPSLFLQHGLVSMVKDALLTSGFPAHRLELEITEEVLISDAERTLEALVELRSLGVQIAMDDFGTGYSSLGYLRRFPFSKIKIDRSFIGDVGGNLGVQAIVGAIINMGHALNMNVIAEGVETMEQADILRAAGCEEAQGFLYSRPMRSKDVQLLLNSANAKAVPEDAVTFMRHSIQGRS